MYLQGGDFDIEDRVSATEGEQVVTGVAFGNYDEEIYGEAESYDVLSIGDFDDSDMGMGFVGRKQSLKRMAKKVSHTAVPKGKPGKPVNTGVPFLNKKAHPGTPVFSKAIKTSVPALAKPKPGTPALRGSVVSQGKHLGWGKKKTVLPSPTAIKAAAKQIVAKKVQQAKNTVIAKALNKGGGVQSVQAAVPRSATKGVAASAGDAIKAADLQVPVESIIAAAAPSSLNDHPLIAGSVSSGLGYEYDAALGEYEAAMGLDFKKMFSELKTSAKTGLENVKAQLPGAGKTLLASFTNKFGEKLTSAPESKAFISSTANRIATEQAVEAWMNPENRKKALYLAAGLATVLAVTKFKTGKYFGGLIP